MIETTEGAAIEYNGAGRGFLVLLADALSDPCLSELCLYIYLISGNCTKHAASQPDHSVHGLVLPALLQTGLTLLSPGTRPQCPRSSLDEDSNVLPQGRVENG